VNLSEAELDALIAEAESQLELDAVIGTRDLADRILNRRTIPSSRLPWPKLHGRLDLRQGEVTIWAGDNGSGKSLLVGQVIGWLLPQQRCLIASMEMRPEETVERIASQLAGCAASPEWVRGFCDWAEGRLWLYDRLDTVESNRVLQMIRAVRHHLGVEHIVIDSLVKCGVKQDGDGAWTAQTQFVDKLQHLAKSLDLHIHLIAHTRKPDRDGGRISKHDIRGASQITDLADNVVLLSRNRRKEALRQLPREALESADFDVLEEPDALLTVAKQRHFGWEGTMGLDFHAASRQYVRHGKDVAMPWPGPNQSAPWEAA
jgi:twinkle protein